MTLNRNGAALITGASSGIGAAYAERLARRGYDLTLVARNRRRLDALACRISDETGRAVEVLEADLTKKEDLAPIETILMQDTRLTMLVNNAGVGTAAPLLQSDVDTMEKMIGLNIVAATRLTYAAVPAFVARGNGALINISSSVAISPDWLCHNHCTTSSPAPECACKSCCRELPPPSFGTLQECPSAICRRD